MSDKQKQDAGEVVLSAMLPNTLAKMTRIMRGGGPAGAAVDDTDSDEHAAAVALLEKLSPPARSGLSAAKPSPAEPDDVEAGVKPKFGLVECPDGEWPHVRTFKTAEGLARRVQQLDGTNTVVWCFFGTPLPVTQGPQRYIVYPDDKRLFSVPLFEGGPCGLVSQEDVGGVVQADGFLGAKELAMPIPTGSKAKATAGGSGVDDEEDNDD